MYDYTSLEFEMFKGYLKRSFSSTFSIHEADNIYPLSSVEEILERQKLYIEILEIIANEKVIENDDDFYNLHLKFDDEFLSLEPVEYIILRNFLKYTEKVKATVLSKKAKLLLNIVNSINTISSLSELITRSIADTGEIKDDATDELKSIRYGLADFKSKVKKALTQTLNSKQADKFIQEKVIIIKNGRYTIPCKTNFSQYIQGIIHDKSTSGQTLYIEPTSCVPINNAMQELVIKESEEIAKILFNLMTSVKYAKDDIHELIVKYKFLAIHLEIAAFFYGKSYCFAEHSDTVKFRQMHHPLLFLRLGEKNSIPIDFDIEKGITSVIVTGPNTGGKTASLKSVGLNHVITFCGLPIFAKFAKFYHFKSILADIGDNQSLVMDLSTFSAHILNMKRIIDVANSDTLLLFDELGTGTEPREGASLAVAILKSLEEKGAVTMVTTHFSELKNFALNNPKAMFYSVDFDYDTFTPRYRLLKGVLGKSDPIMIASRLGFDKDIIAQANLELSKYKTSVEMQVEELNILLAEAQHSKRMLEIKEKELEAKESDIDESEKVLKKRLNSKELELLEESYALLQKGKRILAEKVKVSPNDIDAEIKATEKKIETLKKDRPSVQDIQLGDVIFLERYNKSAKVLSVESDSVNLNMEGMRIKMKKNEVIGRKIEAHKPTKVKITSQGGLNSARKELLLVGKRVEEALDILDKFLDDVTLASYDKVYIIHGRGTGQLKRAIHEHLRQENRVKRYSLADAKEGGDAITVVEI